MYIVLELLACATVVCVLGALLFIASVVLLTVREAINVVSSALGAISRQILRMLASLDDSGRKIVPTQSQAHFGGAAKGLVLNDLGH